MTRLRDALGCALLMLGFFAWSCAAWAVERATGRSLFGEEEA